MYCIYIYIYIYTYTFSCVSRIWMLTCGISRIWTFRTEHKITPAEHPNSNIHINTQNWHV